MRTAPINLRVPPEQREIIDRAAKLLIKNRTDFIMEAAYERAQAVLLDQTFFKLDQEQFERFVAILDAPAAPNEGLERLMAVKAPWEAEGSANSESA